VDAVPAVSWNLAKGILRQQNKIIHANCSFYGRSWLFSHAQKWMVSNTCWMSETTEFHGKQSFACLFVVSSFSVQCDDQWRSYLPIAGIGVVAYPVQDYCVLTFTLPGCFDRLAFLFSCSRCCGIIASDSQARIR
jgi:hypothetical protein